MSTTAGIPPTADRIEALQRSAGNGAATVTLQRYTREKGRGKQGGFFIRGNAQIHLHIEIGKEEHLKIEGKRFNLQGTSGRDVARTQDALDQLLAFRLSIARDKPRASKYAQPIQDCIDWLVENGARMPAETTPGSTDIEPPPEVKPENEAKAPMNDYYANMDTSENPGPISEEDFM